MAELSMWADEVLRGMHRDVMSLLEVQRQTFLELLIEQHGVRHGKQKLELCDVILKVDADQKNRSDKRTMAPRPERVASPQPPCSEASVSDEDCETTRATVHDELGATQDYINTSTNHMLPQIVLDTAPSEASDSVGVKPHIGRQMSMASRAFTGSLKYMEEEVRALEGKTKSKSHHIANISSDGEHACWAERMVLSARFEILFGMLIVLNTLSMCAHAEYQGRYTGYKIGVGGSATDATTDRMFAIAEIAFTVLFTLELLIKVIVLRCNFLECWWNDFDAFVIIISWLDLVLRSLPVNPMVLRLARLVRLARLTRAFAASDAFDTLHLMVRGIKESAHVLVWVIVLLLPMLAVSALAMNYMLAQFIEDEGQDRDTRVKCFNYFGTFGNSMLSMLEMTFANFVPITRFLYEKVGKRYACFLVGYYLVVGIAVLRIVYGVFLHVTLTCATSDEESMIAKKARDLKKNAVKMRDLFNELDADGSGQLSKQEFVRLVQDRRVGNFLAAMDLEIRDPELAYNLTVQGNREMSMEDMVFGFSRMRGNARSLDIMALTAMVKKALEKLDQIQRRETQTLKTMKRALHTNSYHTTRQDSLRASSVKISY